jgi:hypothetical protein
LDKVPTAQEAPATAMTQVEKAVLVEATVLSAAVQTLLPAVMLAVVPVVTAQAMTVVSVSSGPEQPAPFHQLTQAMFNQGETHGTFYSYQRRSTF